MWNRNNKPRRAIGFERDLPRSLLVALVEMPMQDKKLFLRINITARSRKKVVGRVLLVDVTPTEDSITADGRVLGHDDGFVDGRRRLRLVRDAE